MKKLFVLMLSAMMMLGLATVAMGAIHDSFNADFGTPVSGTGYNYATGGGWFYIEKDDPMVQYSYNSLSGYSQLAAEYWQNDHFFLEGNTRNAEWYNEGLKGSYIFNNFFVGLEFAGDDGNRSSTIISPGYKFNLNDNGYLALSADYQFFQVASSNRTEQGVAGFDIDFKYYFTNAKLVAQYYRVKDYYDMNGVLVEDANYFDILLDYKLFDTFVLGLGAGSADEVNNFKVGFTWTPDSWLVDAYVQQFDNAADTTIVRFSTLYSVDKTVGLGFDFLNNSDMDSNMFALKAKFKAANGNVLLTYQLPNDDYTSTVYLRYNKALK